MCTKHKLTILVIVLMAFCATGLFGQETPAQDQSEYLVSLYHVAPGKHLEFLKWMASQEAIAKEAGAPPAQWFAHLNGDSWDYLVINKQLDADKAEEVDRKIEQLTKEKGLPSGMAASLRFRQYVNSHTDTFVLGPFTAAGMVKAAEK